MHPYLIKKPSQDGQGNTVSSGDREFDGRDSMDEESLLECGARARARTR